MSVFGDYADAAVAMGIDRRLSVGPAPGSYPILKSFMQNTITIIKMYFIVVVVIYIFIVVVRKKRKQQLSGKEPKFSELAAEYANH